MIEPRSREQIQAVCPAGHRWNAIQEIKHDTVGDLNRWARIVTPDKCPTCGRRWARAEPLRS